MDQYEADVRFSEDALCAAIQSLSTDDVVCPVCQKWVVIAYTPLTTFFSKPFLFSAVECMCGFVYFSCGFVKGLQCRGMCITFL